MGNSKDLSLRHDSVSSSSRGTPPPAYTVDSPLASHPPVFVIQKPEPVADTHSKSSSVSSTSSLGKDTNFNRPPLTINTSAVPRMPSPPRRQSSLAPSLASSALSYSSHGSAPGVTRPISYVPPSNGRPRKDIPYDSPMLEEYPLPPPPVQQGYLSAPGMQFPAPNRRTTVYFDPNRTNRESFMSYDSRIERRHGADDDQTDEKAGKEKKEKNRGCWKSFWCCFSR